MTPTELILTRHSIRKYKDELVSRADIEAIMQATRFTQSWANTQTARFTFVQDPALIARFASDGVKGFVYNIKTLQNAKNVLVLSTVQGKSGKMKTDGYATDKGAAWEVFDAGIACQTFALAAHAHGVGSCVMGIIDDAAIAQMIGLPEGETVAALIPFGYPAEEGRATPRLAVEELCRFI